MLKLENDVLILKAIENQLLVLNFLFIFEAFTDKTFMLLYELKELSKTSWFGLFFCLSLQNWPNIEDFILF